jgi:hypothetical protein
MGHHAKDYPSSPRRRRRWKPHGSGYISTESVQADKDLSVDHEIPEDLGDKYEGAIDSEVRRGEHARLVVSPDDPHAQPTGTQPPAAPPPQTEEMAPPPDAPPQQRVREQPARSVPTPPGDHHPVVKQARQERGSSPLPGTIQSGRSRLNPHLVSGILLVLAVLGVLGIALLLSFFVVG